MAAPCRRWRSRCGSRTRRCRRRARTLRRRRRPREWRRPGGRGGAPSSTAWSCSRSTRSRSSSSWCATCGARRTRRSSPTTSTSLSWTATWAAGAGAGEGAATGRRGGADPTATRRPRPRGSRRSCPHPRGHPRTGSWRRMAALRCRASSAERCAEEKLKRYTSQYDLHDVNYCRTCELVPVAATAAEWNVYSWKVYDRNVYNWNVYN